MKVKKNQAKFYFQHQYQKKKKNFNKSKKILITGGNGLIGNAIKEILKRKIIIKSIDISSKVEIDITKKKFIKILNKFQPDVVIHTAAHPGGLSMIDPLKNVETNLMATFRIINWCADNSKKIIFLSSSAVYSSKKKGNKETDLPKPRTIYGINKLACENYIKTLGKYKDLNWIIFRLFATYGPGHRPNLYQGIVNIIITQIKLGKKIIIKGSLKRKRDLIFVDDAAKVIAKAALENTFDKQIFNLGSGIKITIGNLIKKINKHTNKRINVKIEKKTYGDPFYSVSNNQKIKKFFKIKEFTPIDSGLKKTIQRLF